KKLREGTSSSQVITHYIKLATTREKMEKDILEKQLALIEAKTENLKATKKMVGFKAAGGVSTVEQAIGYSQLFKKIVGEKYFLNQWFRIGTSRLTEKIYNEILAV
ncbi:MAG: hypothetical protein J6W45_04010, partial [Bacteroidales bacterium]|nr:hypothetical protein [Bacteroidales bacterium]